LPATDRESGVDVGIARLATIATSDGGRSDIANPKHLSRKLRKMRRLEYRLAELPLQIRQWTCPACHVVHDRDHNAAKIILAAGRAERLNACGARVSPQPIAAVSVEAGSTPTAA
jgi:transposase